MVVAVADVAEPFLSFLRSTAAAFLLVSQTFALRLTTSHHLSLSCARYSKQLGSILKDFMQIFSVFLKRFFWCPWDRLPWDNSLKSSFFGKQCGYISYGQDRPNESMISSIWYRCWEEIKLKLKLRCRWCVFAMWCRESSLDRSCESGFSSLSAVDKLFPFHSHPRKIIVVVLFTS